MKFAVVLGLVSLAVAQAPSALVCPTATKTMQNRNCRKTCDFSDCAFVQTIRNPCGCPAALPTATLIAPCEADCPYGGCDIDFRTSALACPTTTSTSSRRTRRPRPTTTTVTMTPTPTSKSTTQTRISIGVTTLPPVRTSTPCPTITRTTSPADCPAIRCPVPTCIARSSMIIPCGCTPRTMLYVQGCATACPEGCATRTETVSVQNC
ncbi:hypothetical protein B0H66DRAFT_613214 [Apodospora peruviana]|uniref:Uncharacterized protein n=1 Tax=Apodospora peruviana TaxID=516989 RepID=A0AAE0ITT1_9PEZI|nr:hypothetical protein B0H66DRAFT_613214 [Apodospora peruviana]